jgi:hypothetical protein
MFVALGNKKTTKILSPLCHQSLAQQQTSLPNKVDVSNKIVQMFFNA